jgi:hypothetical protein
MARTLRTLAYTLPLLLTAWLYGYALRLPFFLDDLLLFDMIRTYPDGAATGLRFWGGAPAFNYYRPLVFSIWEANEMLNVGRFDPFGLHLLNVLLFGLSGVLVGQLVRRCTRAQGAGISAGVAFVLFPFSYNAVIWVASLFHVLMTFALLLALWSALHWLDAGRMWALILCWLAAFIATFSHENGVLLLPLLALLTLLRSGWRELLTRRSVVLAVPILLMLAAFSYAFLFIRTASDTQLRLEQAPESFGLFAQAFVWPLSALARVLFGAEESAVLFYGLFIALVVPALLLAYLRARHLLRWLLFGLGWYLLAALPALLLLETDYIRGSWRLLLLSSVGMAWFWGSLIPPLFNSRHFGGRAIARPYNVVKKGKDAIHGVRFVLFGVMIVACVVGVVFAYQRRDDALRQSAYTWQLQAELLAHTQGEQPMVVNAPQWLAPAEHERLFPTVGLGVQFMGGYVNYYQMLWAHTGEPFPLVQSIFFRPAYAPPDDVSYALYYTIPLEWDFTAQIRSASDLFVTYFDAKHPAGFYPRFVGRPNAPGAETPLASWLDGDIALTEITATLQADTLLLKSRWHVAQARDMTPHFAIYCDERLLLVDAMAVWGGIHPFRAWGAGESQSEQREIRLSDDISGDVDADCLQVHVRVADATDGRAMGAAYVIAISQP